MDSKRTLILMGGGLDSSYIAMYLLRKRDCKDLLGIHFDYGHPGAKHEWAAIKAISKFLGIDVKQEKIKFPFARNEHEILGRNSYLILSASIIAKNKKFDQIALGVHKGSHYYDCSKVFIKDMQGILNGYFQDTLQIVTPLIRLQKNEIFKLAQMDGLPLKLLYSCDEGRKPTCKSCLSCKDWIALNAY
jgi:7-cyano-7-deazaguanine synthase